MALNLRCFKTHVALVFLGGILFAVPTTCFAETEPQKSIRLGVDPEKYLQNRHKRVGHVRQKANQANNAAVPVAAGSGGVALSLHPDLANRPGFNEFSHLSAEERKNAQEIMQFLKNLQPAATP